MKTPFGMLLMTSGLLLASQSALAVNLTITGGSNSFGIDASQVVTPGVRAGIGYLHTDDRGHDAQIYSGSLMFSPAIIELDIAVGGRYQYQDTDLGNGGGLGIGGSVFSATPIPALRVGGYGFFTPQGLTHGDVDESIEYGLQGRLRLFGQTHLFAGYRYLRSDFSGDGNRTLHSGPVLGLNVGLY
ncbi:YfaZ family outer membrane protein [Stutzerimonas tarimensis]|uniref:YfaZ family outer membrane protein n=1 Tax=Stutzerimonas tarimensis TaxID=1507735 RepID=A0ABV7T6J5_9GAMM